MRLCGNCHKPIGLNKHGLPRALVMRPLRWLVFHSRNCKREWKAKRKTDKDRERAVRALFRPP